MYEWLTIVVRFMCLFHQHYVCSVCVCESVNDFLSLLEKFPSTHRQTTMTCRVSSNTISSWEQSAVLPRWDSFRNSLVFTTEHAIKLVLSSEKNKGKTYIFLFVEKDFYDIVLSLR